MKEYLEKLGYSFYYVDYKLEGLSDHVFLNLAMKTYVSVNYTTAYTEYTIERVFEKELKTKLLEL